MTARKIDEIDADFGDPLRTDTVSMRALVEHAATLVGSLSELGRRIDVTGSHLSRIRSGKVGLGVESCIRLADVLEEDRILVLRICGYARLTELIAPLQNGRLPHRPGRLHEALDRLLLSDRRLVTRLIDRLLLGPAAASNDTAPPISSLPYDPPKRGTR
jgi:hypothetical protein